MKNLTFTDMYVCVWGGGVSKNMLRPVGDKASRMITVQLLSEKQISPPPTPRNLKDIYTAVEKIATLKVLSSEMEDGLKTWSNNS